MTNEEKNARIISLIIIAILLITMWYMLDLVLLTFIIAFIFYNLSKVIQSRFDTVSPVKIPNGLILSVCYILFVLLIVIFISEILPMIVGWTKQLSDIFIGMNLYKFIEELDPRIVSIIDFVDINTMIKDMGVKLSSMVATYSTQVAGFLLNLFLAMILSFIILLEKGKIQKFGKNLEKSKFSDIYRYIVKFGGNFCSTFGKVMTVQLIIAAINSVLSMIVLAIMGFTSVPALGLMIFIFGLVPVAGVIISLIPLCIIALSVGGIVKVLEVIIMICVLHAIEAYFLNPKLMSSKTSLPVCFVFIILLVGEHYLGVWGLLIGVPLFIFLMNMLEVDYQVDKKQNKSKNKVTK